MDRQAGVRTGERAGGRAGGQASRRAGRQADSKTCNLVSSHADRQTWQLGRHTDRIDSFTYINALIFKYCSFLYKYYLNMHKIFR